MVRRLAFVLLLIAALAPGTWLRSPVPPFRLDQAVTATPLPLPQGCCAIGPLRLTGAWDLASPNQQFGGYSALVRREQGRLLAISDAGYTMDIPEPGLPGPARLSSLLAPGLWQKADRDTEAAQWDPASRTLWVSTEGRNSVLRFNAAQQLEAFVRPSAMRQWSRNAGPEAMARLDDGRFLVLCECFADWPNQGGHPALLFPGDPVEGGEPLRLDVIGPSNFRPTDMTALPDGRVLVLQRRLIWPMPMRFSARFGLLDLRGVRPGEEVPLQDLGEFPAAIPMDNYEGLTIEPLGQGRYAAWVISDDNNAALQRTLLLAFEFNLADLPDTQKAPG